MSTGTMMVLCADDDTLPISTPNTLRIFIMNQGPQALIAVVPMPFEVAANTVYPVSVTVAGSTLTVLCGTFDNQYLTGSVEQFFLYQNPDGSIPIAAPAQGKGLAVTGSFGPPPSFSTQDYTLAQVTDSFQYWMFSGDTMWVKKHWASIRGIMTWLAGQVGTDGLMSGAGPLATMMSTNAHYYGALRQAEQLATAAGDTASAATYGALAPAFGKRVNSLLFNKTAGMYSASTAQPTVFDEIGNGFALLYGLPALDPSINVATLAANLTKALAGPNGPCESSAAVPDGNIAPYEVGWEVLGRLAAGQSQSALDLIRQVWGLMLPENTPYYSGGCWEYVAQTGLPGLAAGTSLAHGWSSGATPALSMYVLGGRPLAPGYKTFLVEPQPGDLGWASGRIPTPEGPIIIDWTASAHAAAGLTLKVKVPPGTRGYAGVPSTAAHGTVDGVATAPVTVPGYSGLEKYLYFGPLMPGSHRISVD